ncbi:MAG: hypothetical protein NXI04_18915 [Planctomycetaceae bacterium]|nr:hypothetical protein [Planctomycetaceae bacterium]
MFKSFILTVGLLVFPVDEPQQETGLVDRQYHEIWDGLVEAEMNHLYHRTRAAQLNSVQTKDYSQLLLFLSMLALVLPLFIESTWKQTTEKKSIVRAVFLAMSVAFFWGSQHSTAVSRQLQDGIYHQAMAKQWGELSQRWEVVFRTMYWKSEPIDQAEIEFLQVQQNIISGSELDVVDEKLLSQCQKNATESLMKTLTREDRKLM